MSDSLQYQVRIRLAPEHAAIARIDMDNERFASLKAVLGKHNAQLKCQYDAFADYVTQAEREGIEHYPLYRWTRETIDNAEKKAKYLEAFTCYVNGDEVYDKPLADALEADLRTLDANIVKDIRKFDTNPAHNPQPPDYKQT